MSSPATAWASHEIRMGDLWEKYFSDMTFGMFKVKFFNGELLRTGRNQPYLRPCQDYYQLCTGFETTRAKLSYYGGRRSCLTATASTATCSRWKNSAAMHRRHWRRSLGRDFAKALLELPMDENRPTKRDSDRMKSIQARQQGSNKIGMSYRVMNGNYFSCANWMDERPVNCAPNREENEYLGYSPATIGGKQNPVMRLLSCWRFSFISYEVRRDENLEIFAPGHDPQKIRSLSEDLPLRRTSNCRRGSTVVMRMQKK